MVKRATLHEAAGIFTLVTLLLASPFASIGHDPAFCPAPCCSDSSESCCEHHDKSCGDHSLCDECASLFTHKAVVVSSASTDLLRRHQVQVLSLPGCSPQHFFLTRPLIVPQGKRHPPPGFSAHLIQHASVVLLV